MRIGIGLPVAAPGAIPEWARLAENSGFDSVTVPDRWAYDNPEPLIALAGAAGATSRIRLRTQVLLAGLREPVLLAKQIATLDQMCAGRLSLGLGVGEREDDFLAAGVPRSARGSLLDGHLSLLTKRWNGQDGGGEAGRVGPPVTGRGGPELLFGGFGDAAVRRVTQWGAGYVSAFPAEYSGWMFDKVTKAWQVAGRPGRPTLVAQVNTAVGPDEVGEEGRALLRSYYAFMDETDSPVGTDRLAAGMLTTGEQVRKALAAAEDAHVDELVLVCWSTRPSQLARIAAAIR